MLTINNVGARAILAAAVTVALGCDAGEVARDSRAKQPTAPVALAFVLSLNPTYVGTDDFVLGDGRLPGVLNRLKRVVDSELPAAGYPPGSQGLVIGYSTQARVIAPLRPLEQLTGAAFGTQRDYEHETGANALAGVLLAVTELAHVDARRRIIVVFGHDDDSNPEVAQKVLAATERARQRARIELYVIAWPNHSTLYVLARHARRAVEATSEERIRHSLRVISAMPPPLESIWGMPSP